MRIPLWHHVLTALCAPIVLLACWRGHQTFLPGIALVCLGAGLGIVWLILCTRAIIRHTWRLGTLASLFFPVSVSLAVVAMETDIVLMTRIWLSQPALDRMAEEALKTWPECQIRRFPRAGLVWSRAAAKMRGCLYVVTQAGVGFIPWDDGGIVYVPEGAAPNSLKNHVIGRWWKFVDHDGLP